MAETSDLRQHALDIKRRANSSLTAAVIAIGVIFPVFELLRTTLGKNLGEERGQFLWVMLKQTGPSGYICDDELTPFSRQASCQLIRVRQRLRVDNDDVKVQIRGVRAQKCEMLAGSESDSLSRLPLRNSGILPRIEVHNKDSFCGRSAERTELRWH